VIMNTMDLDYKKNIAVIGTGYWGRHLVRNFYELGALKTICDKDESLLESFARQYPGVETCMALSDILRSDDIEGVVIATPAETHYNVAREAILAGKHVFVEKPIVLHESEAIDLIALNQNLNKTLMVGHLLQYHPAFLRIKELSENGDLGRINYIYSHRLTLGQIHFNDSGTGR
jgi:UDP-2-acetamido-3-amino-2,3-dideoxy-glucuronate N-acetyltransferase